MAIIYSLSRAGRHYQIRRAGRAVRLYTNGAFHSAWHPDRQFTGAVWDLLSLPALFQPVPPRNALVLGVGGGTVIHQLHSLFDLKITAIESDPVHLRLARKYFEIDSTGAELIQADAVSWVRRCHRRFDLIVDDLFVDAGPARRGVTEDPLRPRGTDDDWVHKLIQRVSRHGTLVMNFLSPAIARATVADHRALLRSEFSSGRLLTTPKYSNGVLALYRDDRLRTRQQALENSPVPNPERRQLRFRVSAVRL